MDLASFLASAPPLLPSLITAGTAFYVARKTANFTDRKAHLDFLQYVNQSSQELNFLIVRDQVFAKWYRENVNATVPGDENFFRRVYLCQWLINHLRWIHLARRQHFFRQDIGSVFDKRLKRLVRRNAGPLTYILENQDVYDVAWLREALVERLSQLRFDRDDPSSAALLRELTPTGASTT